MTDSSADFRRGVQYVLLTHREKHPLGECDPCERSDMRWPEYRDHMVELIEAVRVDADAKRRRSVNAFTDILAEHAPFKAGSGGLCCNTCLDGRGSGEFPTTLEWARHVEREIANADLLVTSRRGGDA